MRNFFDRLARRALGVAHVAQPLIPPVTALESSNTLVEALAEGPKEQALASAATVEPDTPGDLRESLPARERELALLGEAGISAVRIAENRESVSQPAVATVQHAAAVRLNRGTRPFSAAPRFERTISKAQPNAERAQDRTIGAEPKIPARYSVLDQVIHRVAALSPLPPVNPLSAKPAQNSVSDGSTSAPVIRVTIGRVDVRAQFAQSAPPAPARESRKPSVLTLEQYAKQRSEGKR